MTEPEQQTKKQAVWERENAELSECLTCGQPSHTLRDSSGRDGNVGLCPKHYKGARFHFHG